MWMIETRSPVSQWLVKVQTVHANVRHWVENIIFDKLEKKKKKEIGICPSSLNGAEDMKNKNLEHTWLHAKGTLQFGLFPTVLET